MQNDNKGLVGCIIWFILNGLLYFYIFGFSIPTVLVCILGIPFITFITSFIALFVCEIYEQMILSK